MFHDFVLASGFQGKVGKNQLREDFETINAITLAGQKKRDKKTEAKNRILLNWGKKPMRSNSAKQ